jgi:hypothetical protein
VDENNVVQVIIDNCSNYKKACRYLTNEYLRIAWQPCLAHKINLMLKTIDEFPDQNYLHVLCMIFMVLSCVLCITLIVFIYVYYELFICTTLVDIMLLFFTVFSFYLPIFDKNQPVSDINHPKIDRRFSKKLIDLSANPTDLSVFLVSLFLRHLRYVLIVFF